MTSQDSLDIREVIFINERCRVDYEAMPGDVRESAVAEHNTELKADYDKREGRREKLTKENSSE
jgi:hypothetical protein